MCPNRFKWYLVVTCIQYSDSVSPHIFTLTGFQNVVRNFEIITRVFIFIIRFTIELCFSGESSAFFEEAIIFGHHTHDDLDLIKNDE